MTTGIEMITAERHRQIHGIGYSDLHDDGHDEGELARLASYYAMPPDYRLKVKGEGMMATLPIGWAIKPPVDRLHDLAKAGALVAAELDRLLRINGLAGDEEKSETT